MQYKSVKGYGGWSQLGILFAFIGAGFLLTALFQFIIGMQMIPAGTPINKMGDELLKAMSNPANVGKARLMQIVGTFLLMCVPCLLYMWVCHGKNFFWLGFNKYINIYQVLIGAAIMFVANLLATPLMEMSKSFLAHFPSLNADAIAAEKLYEQQVAMLSNLNNVGEYLLALIIMAFLPAVFEEMLFRGALQNLFNRWWKQALLSVIVTSLLFSFIHASYFLFLSRAILGFVLGWMFYRSKNIWVNIFAHFLNNGLALTALFFSTKEIGKDGLSKVEASMPTWTIFIWVALLVFLFRLFEKYSAKNRIIILQQEEILQKKIDPLYDFPQQQNFA